MNTSNNSTQLFGINTPQGQGSLISSSSKMNSVTKEDLGGYKSIKESIDTITRGLQKK